MITKNLFETQKYIYGFFGWKCENIQEEPESKEYGACSFILNGKKIIFRTSKITPTKVGQFVTFWKRKGKSPIMPYDRADDFDYFVVAVRAGNHFGQFVFSKEVLYQKNIISKNGQGGKRAIRVYPAWDKTNNAQAKRTQAWQLQYFLEVDEDGSFDQDLVCALYNQ